MSSSLTVDNSERSMIATQEAEILAARSEEESLVDAPVIDDQPELAMKGTSRFVCLVAVIALLVFGGQPVQATTFSLDAPSAPANATFPDDLLMVGAGPPPPVPPPLLLPGAIGIPTGLPPVDVDAFTFTQVFPGGHSVLGAEFSVDATSLGLMGTAVASEAGSGDQPADIYGSSLAGGNTLNWDGDGFATPGLGLFGSVGVLELGPASNVDGWDTTPPFGPPAFPGIVYSIGAADALAHPVYAGTGATGAYLFFSPPVPGYSVLPALFATDAALGLGTGDDIDAVAIIEDGIFGPSLGDIIYFSLTPASPTLAGLGASPADILVTSIGGAPAVAFTAMSLGLAGMTDNIDALDLFVIPEPMTYLMLSIGGLALLSHRQRS